MVAQVTARLSWCQQFLSQRYIGTIGLLADLTAEGARQGFLAHLPGNPQQAEDSLNQSGSDAGLFRYRGESPASWRARVGDPWAAHEQAGTPVQVLRAVNEWGEIIFPSTWDPAKVFLIEDSWARFTVFLAAGVVPWGPGNRYGDGHRYGDGSVYGISGIQLEDLETIRRVIRKWKPSRSKGRVTVIFFGVAYDEPGVSYDDGISSYGALATTTGAAYNQTGVTYDGGSVYDGTVDSGRNSATIDV